MLDDGFLLSSEEDDGERSSRPQSRELVFFQDSDGLASRKNSRTNSTPVARVIGGDGDIEVGRTCFSPGRSPVSASVALSPAHRAVVAVVDSVTSLTSDVVGEQPQEMSFGFCGLCSLLLLVLCLLLLGRQVFFRLV